MRPLVPVLALVVAIASAAAGDAPAEAVGSKKPAKKPTAMDLVAAEEKWVYQPTLGREDVFIDLESLLVAQKAAQAPTKSNDHGGGTSPDNIDPQSDDIGKLVAWAKGEEDRIRQAVEAHAYEEAMKLADATLKQLDPHLTRPEMTPVVVMIRTYRAQSEEAKIRNDAQAAFDGLKIRLLGVLWSQQGSRLAILDGVDRALAVNEHFKDCVIINIDQDRVDFRFNFVRRRFEFPVYVEQTARSSP